MSVEQIYRSDLSGEPIAGQPVVIRMTENGHVRILDVSQEEATRIFGDLGRIVKPRGRKKKLAAV